MSRRWFLGLGLITLSLFLGVQLIEAAACAEPMPAPQYQTGEKWTWRDEKGVESTREVVGVEDDLIKIKWSSPRSNPDKEGVYFFDANNVIRKAIRPNGEVITKQGAGAFVSIGQKLLDFPLQVGREWEFSWMSSPSAGGGTLTTYITQYRVLACEEVTTPAGRFSGLKIEARQTNKTSNSSGIFYMWYAPAAKAVIRTQYVASRYWSSPLDSELLRFEAK